ncbi:MAG: TrbC/VirB2 family protein [Rickettsiales bacterium]|nr:TrbC/VirB2 family protein [Rickettsiales bacterium]
MKKIIILCFMIAMSLGTFGIANATPNIGQSPVGSGGSAAEGGTMAVVLCNVLGFVTGTVGKTLASFVIIGVGLGFFTGKVSWGALIGVTLGISALFGSPAIIRAVTGGGNTICGRN